MADGGWRMANGGWQVARTTRQRRSRHLATQRPSSLEPSIYYVINVCVRLRILGSWGWGAGSPEDNNRLLRIRNMLRLQASILIRTPLLAGKRKLPCGTKDLDCWYQIWLVMFSHRPSLHFCNSVTDNCTSAHQSLTTAYPTS
jgi:hypothetical protein